MEQRLCLALVLWNGRDAILKERMFGLTGNEGNHGEDAKEYWWYLDGVPSHSWNKWRYHYPPGAVPVRGSCACEQSARPAPARVRASRYRGLRRKSVLGSRPYELQTGELRSSVHYEPAEPTTSMFGGNSTWRGPVWFPLNYLVVTALEQYHQFLGDRLEIEYPTRSGRKMPLDKIAKDLQQRWISIFLAGPGGRRPCFGTVALFQRDSAWRDNLLFNQYFHGDNGAGLGASHQTGWTGVVADAIRRRYLTFPVLGEVLRGGGRVTAPATQGKAITSTTKSSAG